MMDIQFFEKALFRYILFLDLDSAISMFNSWCSISTNKAGQQPIDDLYTWANQQKDESERTRWLSGLDSGDFQRDPAPYIYGLYQHQKEEILRTQHNLSNKPRKYLRLEKLSEEHVELSEELENKFRQMTALEGIIFLGEFVGAWILSVPENIILEYLRKPENQSYVAQAKRSANMAEQSHFVETDMVYFLERLLHTSWEELWDEQF